MSMRAGMMSTLLAACSIANAAAPWDVEHTGQPSTTAEFTVDEGTWMSVDVSPDGGTLVFDLLGDIYSLPANGGDARLLHGGAAMQRSPRFSPDGKQLLYISDASGGDNVWLSNRDGSGAHALTSQTVNSLTGAQWLPDGRAFVAAQLFSGDDKLHAAQLRLFDLRAGEGRVLVPAPASGENVHEAQFSPDGRYLYYTEKVTPPSNSVVYIDANQIHYAVMRRDLSSGATESLIRGFGSATTPKPSPDGRRIAFVRRVKSKTVLFTYDIVSGEQRPVHAELDRDAQADFTWQGSYYPSYGWFPDSRHVAIWAKGKLWKIDMDNGAATPIPFRVHATHTITTPPRFTHQLAPERFTVRAIRQLAYSPDGGTVVFNALGRLWRKREDAQPVRLTSATALEFEPAFANDGRVAYVEWSDEQGGALKILDPATGVARSLASSGGVLRAPSFSSDGRRLVYKVDAGDRCLGGHDARVGIYWMDLGSGASHYVTIPGEAPMFSADGNRIYYSVASYVDHQTVTTLESVDLNGLDKRVHAMTRDADTSELRLSPDLQWLAFRDRQQYYVGRYREIATPLLVSAASAEFAPVRISDLGGYGLQWSADSKRLGWSVGDILYRATVDGRQPPAVTKAQAGLSVAADHPSGTLAFTNARIITMADDAGAGDGVIERGTLVVRDNRIVALGAADNVSIPASARIIDASGKTIMPGLIDMHGHVNNCYYTSSGLMPQKQQSRYASLAYGVTTNYDPYTSELPSYSQSEMTLSGDMVGPRAIESGFIAFGRHGKGDHAFLPIASYDDARIFMERKRALGGIIVKSYRQPMRSQRQQLIKAGRDTGIMVDVEGESNFFNNITMVLDGNTNLQHNMPVATYYDDVVQLMKHAHSSHTPTLVMTFGELLGENYIYQHTRMWEDPKARAFVQVTTSGYSPLGAPHYAPPHVRGMTTIHAADEIYDVGFRSVSRSMKKLDDAGVTVSAGSHGQVPGLALHWEMWLLAEGGMSNHRVLRAATLNGAKTLGLDAQTGSLEVGKLADLIVLDGNPLEDIHHSNSVRFTMVNGRLYDSYTMNEIGLRERARGKFYWEVGRTRNIVEWNKAWAHQ